MKVRLVVMLAVASVAASAQWLNYPAAGIPRTPDGAPNLAAPAPKTVDGKPVVPGLWRPIGGGYVANIAKDLKPGEVPFQPWTEGFRRRDFGSAEVRITIDDPKAYLRPWTVTVPLGFVPDSELLEYVCNANNKDIQHLVGK